MLLKKKHKVELQSRDTILLISLILIIAYFYSSNKSFLIAQITTLSLGLIFPKVFSPLAKLWFALGEKLGSYSSKMILFATYFLIVAPMALIKKKSLKSKFDFHQDHQSNLIMSDHKEPYNQDDIGHPY